MFIQYNNSSLTQMGRVNNQPPPPPATASLPIIHFTHPHPLRPIPINQIAPTTLCSGCKLQSSEIMYTCIFCNFILHQSCAKLPKQITHPCHVTCTLSLLPVASYPGGHFNCDACNRSGNGWSYHCTRCDYDLHVTCASKPLKIKHQAHGTCVLDLTFKNPYPNTNGFSCDICCGIGANQWLYRCHSCEFDIHLDCAAVINLHPALQHHHSLPSAVNSHFHQNQLIHSASTGSIHHQPAYGQFPGPINGPGQPMMMQGGGMPMNNQPARLDGVGSNLMMSAMQGFVEGAFQGVGQSVVQDVMGGGNSEGNGNGGGGGNGNGGGGGDGNGGGGDVCGYDEF